MKKVSYAEDFEIMDDNLGEVHEPRAEYGAQNRREDFSYEILSHIGIIRSLSNGYAKEFNIISWNGRKPKFDIRDWSSNHTKMSRGVTLTAAEMQELCRLYYQHGKSAMAQMEGAEQAAAPAQPVAAAPVMQTPFDAPMESAAPDEDPQAASFADSATDTEF